MGVVFPIWIIDKRQSVLGVMRYVLDAITREWTEACQCPTQAALGLHLSPTQLPNEFGDEIIDFCLWN